MRQSVPRVLRRSNYTRCLSLSSTGRSWQSAHYRAALTKQGGSPLFARQTRQYASYSRSYTSSKSSRLPNLFVFGVVFGVVLYFLYPHHTFSKEVTKKLREGLRAESRLGNFDHKKGLQCYIEALSIAFSEGLSPLSDEVTGIMVKIAGTYQALQEYDKACSVAGQLITIYEAALLGQKSVMIVDGAPVLRRKHLSDNPRIASIRFEEDPKLRSHYLQRCLLMYAFIATIQSELGQNTFAEQVIMNGLYLAKDEITLKIQMKRQNRLSMEDELQNVTKTTSQEVDLVTALENDKDLLGTFGREFFALGGLLASTSLELHNFMNAAEISQLNAEMMKAFDYPIGDILYSRYVEASAYVMEADRLSLEVDNKEGPAKDETMLKKEKLYAQAEQEFKDILSEGLKIPDSQIAVNKANIEAAANMDEKASNDPMALSNYYVEQSIDYTLAWTRHGLGVVYLGKGKFSEAERLFRKTLEWAKDNNDHLMQQCCKIELDNCKKERKAASLKP